VPEDQLPASVDKAVSIGEVVVRSKSEAQRRAGELEVEKKLRRAASSPLEVGGPVEPRVEHEDARRKQWEEELRRELEVQRAEMRRCHGRDRAVSAV
jgi:aspartate/tyrosine/aromatic aminotransferase